MLSPSPRTTTACTVSSLCLLLLFATDGSGHIHRRPEYLPPPISMGSNSGCHALTTFIRAGGRGIDTAVQYGPRSQQAAGCAIRRAYEDGITRADLYVTSKVVCCPVANPGRSYACEDSFLARGSLTRNIGGALSASAQLRHTLLLLGTSYLDLVLIHWPCANASDTAALYHELEHLAREGEVRALGLSNFDAPRLEALWRGAMNVRPIIDQVGFSVGMRRGPWGRDGATREWLKAHGMVRMAYSPLGGNTRVAVLRDRTVARIAAAMNHTMAYVALRYLAQRSIPFVTAALSTAHIHDDLEAVRDAAHSLSDEHMRTLDRVDLPSDQFLHDL